MSRNVKIEKSPESPRFHLAAIALIAAVILAAYSNTFTASFHFDDSHAIEENPLIKQATGDNIRALLNDYRPVVNMSLMLNYQLNGMNVVGWHIFNIGVHVLNSILVYTFVLWTLALPSFSDAYKHKARWLALFTALLFAAHPVQTESVTYIISRSELLTTFFYLSTFLLFIRGVQTRKFGYYLAACATAFGATGSKQWAITLPAMLLLYDYLFLSKGGVKECASRWYVYLMVALSWTLIFKTTNLTEQGSSFGFNVKTVGETGTITPLMYLLTSLNVLWTYIRLLFLPYGQNIDYDYRLSKTLFEFPTLLSLAGHVAVVAGSFWLYRKKGWRLIPFGAAWFYITLSPVQSFVPIIDVIFEHRLYLPSIGVFLAFVIGFDMFFAMLENRRAERKAATA